MTRDDIIATIENFRTNPAVGADNSAESRVLHNFNTVAEYNQRGESYCGMASSLALEFIQPLLPAGTMIVTATAATGSSCFHHFNVVAARGEEPFIMDLTVAQYFTKPMDSLGDKPYFVGTRDELRAIVTKAQKNTWDFARENYPEENFRTLWDVDLKCEQDFDFSRRMIEAMKKDPRPMLLTESYYHAFAITWGNSARIIHTPRPDPVIFDVPHLGTAMTPEIKNFIKWSTGHKLSRADGPAK